MDDTSFSLRRNAKRAAERAIEAGIAPSIDYGIRVRDDGRFEIAWRTGDPTEDIPTEDIPETEVPETEAHHAEREDEVDKAAATAALAEIDQHPERLVSGQELEERLSAMDEPASDPWPAGTRVAVALSRRRTRTGTIDYRVGADHWRVILDGAAAGISTLYRGDQLSPTDAAPPEPKPVKKERRPASPPANRQPSRSADLDAAAARGIMPEKPIVTSKANPHYQKRFDRLADLAAHGDWDAVRSYEVKGINSYAKMVKQYRDRLLAAHAAQSTEEAS